MSLETTKEKIIYRIAVPISAVIIGALAGVIFSGESCQLGPGTDFMTILGDSGLTGPEKMKALEIYASVTDRPWVLVRSLTTLLLVTAGAWTAFYFMRRR